ncbi:MAG: hypothetical protein WC712_08580 [Candidatus Brocadiia bacterium]
MERFNSTVVRLSHSIIACGAVVITSLAILLGSTIVVSAAPGAEGALEYLRREMDVFSSRMILYDDEASGGERYYPSGALELGTETPTLVVEHSTVNPARGRTCLKVVWKPTGEDHTVQLYWQFPEHNWGKFPGRDLTGADTLSFRARGETGEELAEFVFGGFNKEQRPDMPFRDSCGPVTTKPMQLSRDWAEYSIDLRGQDLSNIIGAFCWTTSGRFNPKGCTFYLDEIAIDKKLLDEPRLVRSFRIERSELSPIALAALDPAVEPFLLNACHVSDNAAMVGALCSSGSQTDVARARLICDAFVQLIKTAGDGHIADAYCCGAVQDKDWTGVVRPRFPYRANRGEKGMPNPHDAPRLEDGSAKGAMASTQAWAGLALLNIWQALGSPDDSQYLASAKSLGRWVSANCSEAPLGFGFTGGGLWEAKPFDPKDAGKPEKWGVLVPVKWQVTQHNALLYSLFLRLAMAEKDVDAKATWIRLADSASRFVDWAFEQGKTDGGRFVAGSSFFEGKFWPNMLQRPLDANTLSVLAFPSKADPWSGALDWVMEKCGADEDVGRGYGYSTASQDIWPEGSGQVAAALLSCGKSKQSALIIDVLETIQNRTQAAGDSKGSIPAAYPKEVLTDFDWKYYPVPHIAATSWYIMAKNRYNPLTGRRLQ